MESADGADWLSDWKWGDFGRSAELSGWGLWRSRLMAGLRKCWKVRRRQWRMVAVQLLLPMASLCVAGILRRLTNNYSAHSPPLNFTRLQPFARSKAFLQLPKQGDWTSVLMRLGKEMNNSGFRVQNIPPNMPMEKALLNESSGQGVPNFFGTYLAALSSVNRSDEPKETAIRLHFNSFAPHVVPTLLSLIHNARLQSLVNDSAYSIQATNDPLPPSSVVVNTFGEEFVLTICLGVGLLLTLALCGLWPAQELNSGARELQRLWGASGLLFWLPHLLLDLGWVSAVHLLVALALQSSEPAFFTQPSCVVDTSLLMTLQAVALLPLVYIAALCFQRPIAVVTKLTLLNITFSQPDFQFHLCCLKASSSFFFQAWCR